MNTANPETAILQTADIEELLSAAGIDFTVVERCPRLDCEICVDPLSAAA